MGGVKTPGALVVARIPSVHVPVCAVKGVRETPCARAPSCVSATLSVGMSATPGMSEPPCVSGVVTSVPECVLPGTPCVKGAPQVEETTSEREAARACEPPCVDETPRVRAPVGVSGVVCVSEARESERPCVGRGTACVRSLYAREMSVGMREHVAASPGVSVRVVVCSLSLATRGSMSARRAWRLRL